jgi:hypothetical protein
MHDIDNSSVVELRSGRSQQLLARSSKVHILIHNRYDPPRLSLIIAEESPSRFNADTYMTISSSK